MAEPTSTLDSIDPFFAIIHDSQWNACIGQQGEERNYVDGFMEAAIELVEAIFDKKLMSQRDTLVLPILYNARHAVELSLKFAIGRLHREGVIAKHHPITNHDILSHWKHLHDSNPGDKLLREGVAELEPFIVSLAKIDDDGQEFRYSKNREGQPSLAGHAVANLRLIRKSLNALGEILKRLQYRVIDVIAERSTGSFTTRCSRSDLLEIAKMLPNRDEWSKSNFDERKAIVKEKFELTNRQFCNALDEIQKNREMNIQIGIESNLLHLSDEHAILTIEEWRKRHPIDDPENELGTDFFGADWEKYRHVRNEIKAAILGTLTPDEIADLETLFYIGRESEPCEFYEKDFEGNKRKNHCRRDVEETVDRMMEKPIFSMGLRMAYPLSVDRLWRIDCDNFSDRILWRLFQHRPPKSAGPSPTKLRLARSHSHRRMDDGLGLSYRSYS